MLPSYRKLVRIQRHRLTAVVWGSGAQRGTRRTRWSASQHCSAPKPGQKAEIRPKANIRVDSNLVLIPVTVTDPLNRFVTGLEKENFKLFEDKKQQIITQFSSEDAPLSVGRGFRLQRQHGPQAGEIAGPSRNFSKLPIPRTNFSWCSSTTPPS